MPPNVFANPFGFSSREIIAALASNPAVFPDGSASAPGIAWASDPDSGFHKTSGSQYFSWNGVRKQRWFAGSSIVVSSEGGLAWTNSSDADGTQDLGLVRDAANTLAQRVLTAAQTFRVYNTFTDALNYERFSMGWSGNIFTLNSQDIAGTGVGRGLRVSAGGTIIGLEESFTPPTGVAASVNVRRDGTSGITQFGVFGAGLTSTSLLHTRLAPSINQASGTYCILDINPTETAIGAGPHFLIRGRIGAGADVFNVDRAGNVSGNQFTLGANLVMSGGVVRMVERADPAAPPANNGYLYMRDNGAGKTQLVALFPTGAVQVIATEP